MHFLQNLVLPLIGHLSVIKANNDLHNGSRSLWKRNDVPYAKPKIFADIDEAFGKFMHDMSQTDKDVSQDNLTILSNSPPLTPGQWVALGDSFAAGPGTGKIKNDPYPACIRGSHAYPLLLQNDPDLPGPPKSNNAPAFNFKACTGDVTLNLTDTRNPNYQLGSVSAATDFATLSIGGNDIKFSDILQLCVYGIGSPLSSCNQLLDDSRLILYSRDFHTNYLRVLQEILNRMQWNQRQPYRTAIYQTGYSQFFDSYTTQCTGRGLLPGGIGPHMDRSIRIELNRLTHQVNYVLQYNIDVMNVQYTGPIPPPRGGGPGMVTPIEFVDADVGYNRHRICREGVREPDYNNPDTWFFHLKLFDRPSTQNRSDEELANLTQQEIQKYNQNPHIQRPLWVTKTFHPTPEGMERTKEIILYPKLYARLAHRKLPARPIRIMVVGDYVPYGDQRPSSDVYQGFMRHLAALIRDRGMYGVPWGAPTPEAEFVGSQQPIHTGAYPHECYQQATVNMLHNRLRQSPALDEQDKIVLLMAGTLDLFYEHDLTNIVERVSLIIIDILERDPTATVLLGHIPMMGTPRDDGSMWRPLNKRIVEYNARLSALSDQLFTQGWKVIKVHTTATTLDHSEGNYMRPNTRGYVRLAYDFLQGITFINLLEWVRPQTAENGASRAPGTDISENVEAKVTCHDEGEGQGIPPKDDIVKSITRGLDVETFVKSIACNASEICKWAVDGEYGDATQPQMLVQNATTCIWVGEESGSPNHAQVQVKKSGNFDLSSSQECKDAVRGLLDNCPTAHGGYWKGKDGLYIQLMNLMSQPHTSQ